MRGTILKRKRHWRLETLDLLDLLNFTVVCLLVHCFHLCSQSTLSRSCCSACCSDFKDAYLRARDLYNVIIQFSPRHETSTVKPLAAHCW